MSWTHIVIGLTECIQSMLLETLIQRKKKEKTINMQDRISSLGRDSL